MVVFVCGLVVADPVRVAHHERGAPCLTVGGPTDGQITRDDLEAQFREVQGGVDQARRAAKDTVVPFAIAGGLSLLLLVYLLGKRVGKKKSTIVEIRRI